MNVLNIPAFQRKRSISAKARKLSATPRIKSIRKTRKIQRKRTLITPQIEERTINDLFRPALPSEDLFPSPLMDGLEKSDYSSSASSFREMQICGRCEGYFEKIDVAVIQLTSSIRSGEQIIFETDNGLFEQEISSIQINRKDVSIARAGDDIGLKVIARPKVGGSVYKII